MGYEFLIKIKLTAEEKSELMNLFKRKSIYSSAVTVDDKEYLEFRNTNFQSQLPDFTTAFNKKGIYVCQNLTTDVWTNLDDLKEYLLKYQKEFNIEEL